VLDADLPSLIASLAIRADFLSEATRSEMTKNVHVGEKIEFYGNRNLVGSDPRAWASQMAASAAAGRTCKRDPTLHIVISLAPGESLSRAQCERLIDMILLHLTTPGAASTANLPVVWGTHVNTQNWHMHLVLSRVDPWTRRPVRLGNGWTKDTLQQICTLLEGEFGLRHEAQNDYCLTGGYLVHKPTGTRAARPGELIRLRKGVRAQTARSRVATAAHEALRDAIDRAGSWQEVHERLSTLKCSYRAGGKGARITMPDGSQLKASAVGKRYTIAGLARLGEFVPSAEDARSSRYLEFMKMRLAAEARINSMESEFRDCDKVAILCRAAARSLRNTPSNEFAWRAAGSPRQPNITEPCVLARRGLELPPDRIPFELHDVKLDRFSREPYTVYADLIVMHLTDEMTVAAALRLATAKWQSVEALGAPAFVSQVERLVRGTGHRKELGAPPPVEQKPSSSPDIESSSQVPQLNAEPAAATENRSDSSSPKPLPSPLVQVAVASATASPAERVTRPPSPFATREPQAQAPPASASAFDDAREHKPEVIREARPSSQKDASAQKAIPSLSQQSPVPVRTADPIASATTIEAPRTKAQQKSEVPLPSTGDPVGKANQERLAAAFRRWLEVQRSEGRFVTTDRDGRPQSPDLTAEVDEIAGKLQGETKAAILAEFARRHESDLQRLRQFLLSIAKDSRRYPITRDLRIGVTKAPSDIVQLLVIYRDDASLQALRKAIVDERMKEAERTLKKELERLHDRGTFVLRGRDGQPAPPPEAKRAWAAVHPERRAAAVQPFLDRQDTEITELQAWCAEPGREKQRDLFAEDGRLDPTDPSPRIASLMKLYEADPRFHEIVAELRRRVDAHRVLQADIARARYNEGWGREVN
jgi:hypothetical protein